MSFAINHKLCPISHVPPWTVWCPGVGEQQDTESHHNQYTIFTYHFHEMSFTNNFITYHFDITMFTISSAFSIPIV